MNEINEIQKYQPQEIARTNNAVRVTNKLLATIEPQLIPYRKGDKWGYCTPDKKIIVECVYDRTWPFFEGMGIVELNKKFGFLNAKGFLEISPEFDTAGRFIEGFALVKIDGYYGFIDKTGKLAIPAVYETAGHFNKGLAVVNLNNKYGFIDKNGNIIIPLNYEGAHSFKEGFAAVKLNGKYGFIDREGKLKILNEFEKVISFVSGLAVVCLNKKWGLIDPMGNIVLPFIYNKVEIFDKAGIIVVYLDWKRKFIDFSGNELSIFNEYPHLENFSEGLASFQEDSGNKWGVINRNGEVVIPCKEESFRIGPFENGLALVYQNFWFYDYQGKGIETVITMTVGYLCKKGTEYWEDSSDPMYFVRKGNDNLEIKKDTSQINNILIELISPEYATYLYSKAILIDNNCFIAYFKRGALKLRRREYTEAYADFSKAIELNPNDYKSYLQRGGASFFKGDYAEAIDDYTKSISLNPDNWISYLNRANAWFTIGQYTFAITDCSLALEIEPQNGECYFHRGKAKHMLEDLTACDDWRSASKLGIRKALEMLEKYCK